MNPYLIGGGLAVVAVLGFLLKNSYERNGELEAKLQTQVAETEECVAANGTNQTAITNLSERIAAMVEERRVDAQERERILAERDRERAERERLADELEREREDEILANEDCRDLRSLPVRDACPATAEQLRVRSRDTGSDGDGDG